MLRQKIMVVRALTEPEEPGLQISFNNISIPLFNEDHSAIVVL